MTTGALNIESASIEAFEGREAVSDQALGFWFYLMSDLALFAAIFAAYAVLAHNYAGGPTGKDLIHLPYTFGETMLLLLSSATCGLAMHPGQRGRVLM